MKLPVYIGLCLVLFCIELYMRVITHAPVSFLPVFIIWAVLNAKQDKTPQHSVLLMLFYDAFNATPFGLITLGMALTIAFAVILKKRITLDRGSALLFSVVWFGLYGLYTMIIMLALHHAIYITVIPFILAQWLCLALLVTVGTHAYRSYSLSHVRSHQ